MKSLIGFIEKSYMNFRGGRRSSRISLISFIEKSYMIFKGTGTVFFEDSGISLIVFSEKSCMIFKGTGLPIKAKKEYIL